MKRLTWKPSGALFALFLLAAAVTLAGWQTPELDKLASAGSALAKADPLAAELRKRQPDDPTRRGFEIGMGAAEGQTLPGPGKDVIRAKLGRAERAGFDLGVLFSLDRNRNLDLARVGAAIAAKNAALETVRTADPDVMAWLGFDIATGLFGDPKLGAKGNTLTGPGSLKIRDALGEAGQRGFNASLRFHGIPVPPPAKSAPVSRPRTPPAGNPPPGSTENGTEVSVEMKYIGAFTWDRLKYAEPEILNSLVQSINSGTLPKETLRGYGDSAATEELLKSGIGVGTATPTGGASSKFDTSATVTAANKSGNDRGALYGSLLKTPPANKSGNGPIAAKDRISTKLTPLLMFCRPSELNIGDVADKRTGYATVKVRVPQDGTIEATLNDKKYFRIDRLAKYDGLIVDATGRRSPAKLVTTAPFKIQAYKGETVEFRVAYSPQFNLVDYGAAYYNAELTVVSRTPALLGEPQKASETAVPIKARFTGLALGVILTSDELGPNFLTPSSYYPNGTTPFQVKVTLTNLGQAVDGRLVADDTPPGVTMAPIAVHLNQGEIKTVTVPLVVQNDKEFFKSNDGDTYPLAVRFEHGGVNSNLLFWISKYQGMHQWEFRGNCWPMNYVATMTVFGDGRFHFYGQAHNGHVLSYHVSFNGYFDGRKMVSASRSVSHAETGIVSYGWVNREFADHFVEFRQKTFTLVVRAWMQ